MYEKDPIDLLLIEDNTDYAWMVGEVLKVSEYFDYHITHVDFFSHAERHMSAQEWDVVVLDLHLPNGRGTELVRRTRKLCPWDRTVLVVATAFPDEIEEIEIRKKLANDYIDKNILSITDQEFLYRLRRSAALAVGCREAKRATAEMKELKNEMKEMIQVQESVATAPSKGR